ncbi:MAG: cystathionine gamma-synthase family protein [Bacteroidetes bacterium]|nr:cystathionine gamma-synthase family protein [Bacteroidota bacterium]
MNDRNLHPESLMMSYGYNPEWSEGAIKCPIFQTSTFVFKTAEEGKAFFEVAYGLRDQRPNEKMGLIYSRINNPDLEILENRLTLWDGAEDCAVFESGMSAISTVLLEYLKPGDSILYSSPLYGGTEHFLQHVLTQFGVNIIRFKTGQDRAAMIDIVRQSGHAATLKMVYIETPANPTNDLIDIADCRAVADFFSTDDKPVHLTVDNTYFGPLWQHPLKHGADIVVYSATKYIGGHSDVIAGAVLGSAKVIKRIKTLRTFLGNMAGPWTGWLLLRSLETLKARMALQAENARHVAEYLRSHPKIERVNYLGFLSEKDGVQYEIFRRQCTSGGAMLSFDVVGGEKEAFAFLNNLKLIKLAVSLGSTESLAEHPATMTHVDLDPAEKKELNITGKLVRLSVGVEHYEDLIKDIAQALEHIQAAAPVMA